MSALRSSVTVDRAPEGTIGGYLSRPAEATKAGLIVVPEVFGVTVAMRDIADELAAVGYSVLVPDLFWRMEPGVELGNGEDPVLRAKALSLLGRFDVELGVSDLCACVAHLRSTLPDDAKVGIVGFCIGGRMSALVAATNSVDAAVAFYGVNLDRYLDRIRAIERPTQFHFGELDTHIPKTAVDAVREVAAASPNPAMEVHVYPGAGHAFYNPHRKDSFSSTAAAAARDALGRFLQSHLQ